MRTVPMKVKAKHASEYGHYLLKKVGFLKEDEYWGVRGLANKISKYRGEFTPGENRNHDESIEYLFDLFVNNKELAP